MTQLPPIYIHGLESGPHGSKATYVRERFAGSAPAMPSRYEGHRRRPECFEPSVEVAAAHVRERGASILVGSSFGGAVTMTLLQRGVWRGPVVLLAPAIALYELDLVLPEGCSAIVIHDPADDVVPYEGMEAFVRANPDRAELWASTGGHRLSTIIERGVLARAIERQMLVARGEG